MASPAVQAMLWTSRARPVAGWTAIAAVGLMVAAALYEAILGGKWWSDSKALTSAALFGVSVAVMISCSYGIRARPKLAHMIAMSIGIWAAIIGWFLSLIPTWEIITSFDPNAYELESKFGRASGIAYCFAMATALDGLLQLLSIRGVPVWTRRITVVSGYLCAAAVSTAIVTDDSYDPVERAVVATMALAGGGAIATVVLRAMFPEFRATASEPLEGEAAAEISCPACRSVHRIALKRRVECPSCALGIFLRLDAPKCACGYDVTGLTTRSCPECDAPVEQRHAWALAPHG